MSRRVALTSSKPLPALPGASTLFTPFAANAEPTPGMKTTKKGFDRIIQKVMTDAKNDPELKAIAAQNAALDQRMTTLTPPKKKGFTLTPPKRRRPKKDPFGKSKKKGQKKKKTPKKKKTKKGKNPKFNIANFAKRRQGGGRRKVTSAPGKAALKRLCLNRNTTLLSLLKRIPELKKKIHTLGIKGVKK